jgi:Rhodopirellula transposase DDE domain
MRMGHAVYPEAGELLVTADSGGSNGSRSRLWACCQNTVTRRSA